MTQSPLPSSTPESLDLVLDAFATGDSRPLDTLDPETAATWSLLQEWTLLGGLDGLEPQAATPGAVATNHFHAWSNRPPSERTTSMQLNGTIHPSTTPPAPIARRLPGTVFNMVDWLVIIALAGGAIWGVAPHLRDSETSDSPQLSMFADASPETTPAVDLSESVNYGGDTGRSWVLSENDPLLGDATILGTLADGPVAISGPPLIVGDIMIVTMQVGADAEDPAAYQTVGYNLASRKIIWTSDHALHGPFSTDGEFIAGYALGVDVDPLTRVPAVARLDDGSMVMQYLLPSFDSTARHTATNVVAHDGIAYFSNNLGHVWAVNIGTFEEVWAAFDFGARVHSFPESPGFANGLPPSDLIVTDQYVFTIRPSMTVVRYNRLTGQQNGSFNLVDELNGDINSATLQAVGNKLVIAAHREPRNPGDYAPTTILVYGLDSLDFLTRADMTTVESNLVVTLEWIYVVGRTDDSGWSRLYRINPVTGEVSEPVADYQVPEGGMIGLSLAGSTLMMTGPTTEYAFIDIDSRELVESGIVDANTQALLQGVPAQLWNDRPIAVTELGTIVVFGDIPEG